MRAKTSGYFKKIKTYIPYVNEYLTKSILDKEHEEELRYCLNWGCEQQYKQIDNKKNRLCQKKLVMLKIDIM